MTNTTNSGTAATQAPSGEAAVRSILESHAVYLSADTIRQIVAAANPAAVPASDARIAELTEALRNRNDSAHREREKLVAHIHKLETALWKMGTAGETALKEIRSAAPASGRFEAAGVEALSAALVEHLDIAPASAQQGEVCHSPVCDDRCRFPSCMGPASAQQGEDEPPLPKAVWWACNGGEGTEFHPTEEQAKRYAVDGVAVPYFHDQQVLADRRTYHAHMMRKLGDGKRTDLSVRLRETADQHPGWKSLLTQAADEIERYYCGMLNWKRAAATTVPASESIDTAEFRRLTFAYAEALHHGTAPATQAAWATLIAHINAWHAARVEKERAAGAPKDTPESMAASNARFAIDGAIQYGRENRNPPPSTEHWLYEYWNIGRQLARLGETGWDNVTPLGTDTAAPSPAAAKEGGA